MKPPDLGETVHVINTPSQDGHLIPIIQQKIEEVF